MALNVSGQSAEIEVIDTGVGSAAEDPEALFERLFRAPNAVGQQKQGAGLGLTIALAISRPTPARSRSSAAARRAPPSG